MPWPSAPNVGYFVPSGRVVVAETSVHVPTSCFACCARLSDSPDSIKAPTSAMPPKDPTTSRNRLLIKIPPSVKTPNGTPVVVAVRGLPRDDASQIVRHGRTRLATVSIATSAAFLDPCAGRLQIRLRCRVGTGRTEKNGPCGPKVNPRVSRQLTRVAYSKRRAYAVARLTQSVA